MSLYEIHYVSRTSEQARLKEQQQNILKALQGLSITTKLQQQQEADRLLSRKHLPTTQLHSLSLDAWFPTRYLDVAVECRPYTPYVPETGIDSMTSTTCSSDSNSILTRQRTTSTSSTTSFFSEKDTDVKIEIEERDQYGFKRPVQWIEPRLLQEFDTKYKHTLRKQTKSWNKLFDNNDRQWPTLCSELSRYVRYGVPQNIRAKAWMHYSGANIKMKQNEGVYQSLTSKTDRNEYATIIERDLYRTFPNHPLFGSEETDTKIPMLRRILTAFSIYNTDIGYCQSLNFLAAFLLIIINDEEQVFWLFVTTIQDYFPTDMFNKTMQGAQIEQTVLMMMVYEKLPGVWSKISNKKCFWECEQTDSLPAITLVTSHWFLTMFINILPVETVLRIWDCFFIGEGYKVLYQVALTIMKLNEKVIWDAQDSIDTIQILQNMPRRLIDCHEFIKSVFSPHGIAFDITIQEINRKRDLFRNRKTQRQN
ncbi:hypothetical protein INT48_003346 [Thamnidium elegans]|uniref:Rab-GAP TBC domain-containing protein n=1 Tax=Thamnidium elegans TaxID=101142 RepID=A0A8H7SMM5_9FUNG|nr:hypothetical protein INT48_003346 [Thamnidium elegans]